MTIHEKINIRSYFDKKVNRAIEANNFTKEDLSIWKWNLKPYFKTN